jgi:hypothetical protein
MLPSALKSAAAMEELRMASPPVRFWMVGVAKVPSPLPRAMANSAWLAEVSARKARSSLPSLLKSTTAGMPYTFAARVMGVGVLKVPSPLPM